MAVKKLNRKKLGKNAFCLGILRVLAGLIACLLTDPQIVQPIEKDAKVSAKTTPQSLMNNMSLVVGPKKSAQFPQHETLQQTKFSCSLIKLANVSKIRTRKMIIPP